jgi:uncharacterized protein YndB with AHSA1/START domain
LRYRFLTTWLLQAPREDVFQAIWDSESWPSWWRGVEAVEKTDPGGEEGVGSVGTYVWKSRLPYRLEFELRTTVVDRPRYMEGQADGELAGAGRWRLFEDAGVTAVVYDWDVQTTRPWMNLLAPVARPVFAWNHDYVMRAGGEGLARRLDATLVASD